MNNVWRWVIVLWLTVGCSSSDSDPDGQMVALHEEVAAVSLKHKDDCKKMGESLLALVESKAGQLAEYQALDAKRTAEARAAFEARYGERLQAATEKLMPAQLKCKNDKGLQRAMLKL